MKKQEFFQKVDEVILYIAKNDYQSAVLLADELDLDLLQEPNKLVSIAKAYEKCRRYIDAEDLLELARESAPKSRSILFHLCNVTTKAGELKKAEDYLDEFQKIARGDSQTYVLQYRLAAAKKAPDEELMSILERYWAVEPNDKWLYVLAELYAKNGMDDKAIDVCNEITLWFDSGKYVRMAEELRAQLGGVEPDLSGDFDTEGWDPELIRDMEEEKEQAEWEKTSQFAKRKEENQYYQTTITEKKPAKPSKEPEKEVEEPVEEEKEDETPSYSSIYSAPQPAGYVQPTKKYEAEEVEEKEEEYEVEMPEELDDMEEEVLSSDTITIPVDLKEEEEKVETSVTEDIPLEETSTSDSEMYFFPDLPEETEEPTTEVEEKPVETVSEETIEVDESYFEDISLVLSEEAIEEGAEEPQNTKEEEPVFVPVETQENEFESDTEGAKALREKTELSMTPDEWDQIVFEDGDTEELPELTEEIPVIEDEEVAEEHVVISVTTVSEEKQEEVQKEEVKKEEEKLPEIQFDFDEETKAEETEPVKQEEFEAEFVFPKDSEVTAAGASDKDMLDMLFDSEDGQEAVAKELAKRKSEKALFGNIPIRPSADDGLWHFIVYGESSALTLECAREEIKEIEAANSSCPEKMLKISAEKIKGASIINSLDRFLGSTIIVEEASKLSDSQLRDFTKILDKDDRSLLVIFTDTREQVIDMLKRMPALGDCFTGIFEGKRYTPDDLVEVAKEYLFTEAAKLSKDGEEAVYEEGRRLLSERKGYYRNDIIDYVSRALQIADKGGFLGLMGGKCDKEGYLIVSAKHFKKVNK